MFTDAVYIIVDDQALPVPPQLFMVATEISQTSYTPTNQRVSLFTSPLRLDLVLCRSLSECRLLLASWVSGEMRCLTSKDPRCWTPSPPMTDASYRSSSLRIDGPNPISCSPASTRSTSRRILKAIVLCPIAVGIYSFKLPLIIPHNSVCGSLGDRRCSDQSEWYCYWEKLSRVEDSVSIFLTWCSIEPNVFRIDIGTNAVWAYLTLLGYLEQDCCRGPYRYGRANQIQGI
jgi:hypothetical protein